MGRGTKEEQTLYQTAHAQVIAASLPIALGGALLAAPLMSQVFGDDYFAAGMPLSILIWSVPFSLFRNVAIAGLVARERQDQMLKTTIWSTVLNLALNITLIPRWGMAGAALATLLTEILRTALALAYAKQESLHFAALSRHWRACIAGASMSAAVFFTAQYGVWIAIPIGAVTYTIAMIAVGGIRFSNRRPHLQV
jgi:O-antigen/teichoic acid export membrane protein